MDNIVCGGCSVSQMIRFRRCIFSKHRTISRHLNEKYNISNSAGEELINLESVPEHLMNFSQSLCCKKQLLCHFKLHQD